MAFDVATSSIELFDSKKVDGRLGLMAFDVATSSIELFDSKKVDGRRESNSRLTDHNRTFYH